MRSNGFAVGSDTRIAWSYIPSAGVMHWAVTGRDERVVTTLTVGLVEMLGVEDRESHVSRDQETGLWIRRGNVKADGDEIMQALKILVEERL